MRFHVAAVLAASATMILAGCGSSESSLNADFTKAINAYEASQSCLSVGPEIAGRWASNNEYPLQIWTVPGFPGRDTRANALAKAGLVRVVAGEGKEFPDSRVSISFKTYALTELGRKSLDPANAHKFCVGHQSVVSIKSHSETGSPVGPLQHVVFSLTVKDAPSWVGNPDLKAAFVNELGQIQKPIFSELDLEKSSHGWSVVH